MELPKQKVDVKGFESYGFCFEIVAVDGGDTVNILLTFPDKFPIELAIHTGQMLSLVVKK